MIARFVDTNILLRHLLNDHPSQSPACLALFKAIERGEIIVWTTNLVIAELVYVLSSKRTYDVPRETIRDLLLPLIHLPGFRLPRKRLYDRVFDLFTTFPIDFPDAYHAARLEAEGQTELYSYDTDFDRIAGLHRIEP